MFNFGALSESLKILTPRLMLSICILCGVLLLIPAQVLSDLGMTSLMTTNRPWIAMGFLGSGSLLFGYGSFEFFPKWTKAVHFTIRRRRRAQRLSIDEKRVMQAYIRNNTRTWRFNPDSGVVSGLIAYGFVNQASPLGDAISGLPFNITDWAYRYFEKHPKLIDTHGVDPLNPLEGLP